ncbi:Glycosyltransferase [Paramagnetospirillum magnetotacticum MS-1]|uniref:Glycosyltransferase n=1 Tax=Paramagnetospirillum magnetotacticum MS-1 TaxID=272627 RepID=A0A0C2YSX0_PARME|nr:glycosyltransferase family 4 protein [Paramagnetospirillum magnetotacticum]KIL98233.1 Glycosyltransferase [Paramagnetospirillum magnetotacticum MS-1]
MDHVAPIEAPSAAIRQPVVLQVLPALVTGGVERGTVDMAVALAEAGWKALVVSEGGPMVRELTRAGAEHITLPLASKNPLTIRANALKLADIITAHGVDIVHARSRAPAWSAWIAAQATGAHYLTTFHGTYNLGWFGLKQKYNAVMTRGEKVIAISDFIAEHARRIYGLDADRVRVVHRGIDMTRFDPTRVSPERIIQLAQKWRLPDGYQVIMLPGRLTRWKGQAVLIEALALLGRHDVRCLLVGSDQGRTGYREELVELIKRRDLTDVVHLVDECNDMPAAYMLTDVVVSASTDPEAFGRIAVEGQAMGRPVIATAHGATDETVLPGRTGWLTAPGDPAALAQALDRFLALSPEERDLMAHDAMDFVRSRFSKESMCASTLGVYREVLGISQPASDE